MTFSKKVRNVLCLMIAAALVFAACGAPAAPPAPATPAAPGTPAAPAAPAAPAPATGDVVTLDFWTWRVEDVDFYQAQLDIFESRNPNIRVNMTAIRSTDYNTMLSAALAGGGGPDVLKTRSYGGLQVFTDSGYLLPLDGLLPELDGFYDHLLAGAMSVTDGLIYGVPAISQTVFIYYNTDIYAELGLSIPRTWGEFLSNLEATRDAGFVPLANGSLEGWTLEIMLGAIGPTFYGGNQFFDRVMVGDTTFEDPIFIAAVDRLNELTPFMPNQFYGVSYTDMQISFANGISAHFVGGSFEAANFLSLNPDINFDIFAAPGDSPNDTAYVSTYIDMNFSINQATPHVEESLELLRFFASQEFGQAVVNELSMISSVPGVDVSGNAFISRILELQENSTPYIFFVGFRFQQPTGSSIFQAASQAMLVGDMTAAELASELQRGIAEYFEPFQ